MPEYRRPWLPGSYFVTIVTYRRRHLFTHERVVGHWRRALQQSRQERPFRIDAAVILPDHLHLIVNLPDGQTDLSSRIGRAKMLFTKAQRHGHGTKQAPTASRRSQREAAFWQRRFYDHWLRNESEYEAYFDYLHYNPVHHGYVDVPADWPWSSFHHWVRQDVYDTHWGRALDVGRLQRVAEHIGE